VSCRNATAKSRAVTAKMSYRNVNAALSRKKNRDDKQFEVATLALKLGIKV